MQLVLKQAWTSLRGLKTVFEGMNKLADLMFLDSYAGQQLPNQ